MRKSTRVTNDTDAMARAIALGEKARVISPPNPWVGCVVVQGNQIVGEGHSHTNGTPHAEIAALEAAGEKARGSTVYVSLEPCSHYGKTLPSAKALIQAQVAKVVVALEDPDSKVSGRGIRMLRDAGIEVTVGVGIEAATRSLEPYLWQRKTGRPFCIAKAAISIDGRIAAADRSSQWITSPEARLDAHRLRACSQAVMIGSVTAVVDKPQLTVRHVETPPAQQPIRVILDTGGRALPPSPLFDASQAPTLIFTTNKCPAKVKKAWQEAGAEVDELPSSSEGVDLQAAMKALGKRGIIQLLIEGGSTLLGSMLQQRLINLLTVYVGPCILGENGLPLFRGLPIPTIDEAPKFNLLNFSQIGDCLRLDYHPH